MVGKIIEFSAKNPFLVFLLVGMVTLGGYYSMRQVPVDAIPDLSDTQVIVYSRWDRSPDIIEDQVTYPIITALLGAPRVKAIRGFSDFGFSYVYIIFQEGTDIYWARSRTLEYLSKILPRLPEGVQTEIGPDATGVGWVFQYALVDETGQRDLQELRSFQDWFLRYQLQSVPGVAEVAGIGGFGKQYQVTVDPNKLLAYHIPVGRVVDAVRSGNVEVGGRLLEFSGAEYMVRGRGYVKSVKDIEDIVVQTDDKGVPILVKNVAQVGLGPDIRRGVADLDGRGDVVGGIVIMRYKENALKVIERVKERLKEIEPAFPQGVKIEVTYDRSQLIKEAVGTVQETLVEELIIVCLMIGFFLLHVPSTMIPVIALPIGILIAFIPLLGMKLTSNIMSLGGIVIAIGDMVDASIIIVENAHKRLDEWSRGLRKGTREEVLIESMKEVGPTIFASLVVIAVAFMPVFTLEAQEGRLFKPLAFTKNFAILFSAVLAITLVPALVMTFLKGKIPSAENHPVSRFLVQHYTAVVDWSIRCRKRIVLAAVAVVLLTVPAFFKIGSEFMPPLNEGTILYMPTTLPGLSVTEAGKLIQAQDKILKTFPEVERVFGKSGRADTSTDPAPFSMIETTVVLKPEADWRFLRRWHSGLPGFLKAPLRVVWPERLSYEQLIREMDQKLQFAGVTNAWTMPIKARTDMLTTGVRTPIGIKIYGGDINRIEGLGTHLESILKDIPGTRSVYAERIGGGYFVDFDLKRKELGRYGLSVADVQMVIMSAIGGENITTTVEGRQRYPVNVRYARAFRENIDALKRVLVATPSGAQVPLAQVADIEVRSGPSMIRDENGLLSGYVYVDMAGRDVGGYVTEAKRVVREKLNLPTGYSLVWSGQYEFMERVRERLKIFVPLTLAIIFVLYFFTFRSVTETMIIMLSVPFALVGGIWSVLLLGYNMSIAVWVGFIALLGIAVETGSVMLTYLDEVYERRKKEQKMTSLEDLCHAVREGAAPRIRPILMTVAANIFGLVPVMWSTGTGADVMKRIAAPVMGGLTSSMVLTLVVLPAVYVIWKGDWGMRRKQ
ncbi:MAG: efflux RND transporter permease subunit [Candidatus Omnitrophica bacterium]|nr:efflux RND transporter permease subunit [Candidatus Omnitrophota bacterium]